MPGASCILFMNLLGVRDDLRYSAALHRFRQAVSFGLVRGRYKLPGEHLLLALDPHELLDNLNSPLHYNPSSFFFFLFLLYRVIFHNTAIYTSWNFPVNQTMQPFTMRGGDGAP